MIFALAGNQNCGKTTLFNALTGANQHVGNFPGVTVDQKAGTIRNTEHQVIDLPGIYSIRPYSQEEIVTRDFILKEKPDAIINIVDATNIERNLYLSLQLLTLRVPMVIALNMMDELSGNGGSIGFTVPLDGAIPKQIGKAPQGNVGHTADPHALAVQNLNTVEQNGRFGCALRKNGSDARRRSKGGSRREQHTYG